MAVHAELEAWLRLSLLPGLGPQSLRRLLIALGSPEAVLAASQPTLRAIVSDRIAMAIGKGGADRSTWSAVEPWLEDPANRIITLADAEYPESLLEIPDPPVLLYVKGHHNLIRRPGLAVVGSRNATAQGVANAEAFAGALSHAGLTIVSGLALGIDAAAHRGGLAGTGSTVAVVGTGLDVVYPARNRDLAHRIAEQGALVSEFPLGTPALAANFPRRNRLICGLCKGCLIVEAAISSGSLITARLAAEQGREVFAIPGSIHSPLSKGCHALIKQGAKLVESAQDILEELGLQHPPEPPHANRTARKDDHPLLRHIGFEPVDIDTLQLRSGLPIDSINTSLTELEVSGAIAALPGNRWQRVF
ncbi:MAG: DNA-processing protein DprA [Burkholderiales bacterium]|nr:DNA-processing protein DprA [Burkholderiales bacterium]